MTKIHSIMFAQQPDIQYLCDEKWDIPEYGQERLNLPDGIHRGQHGRNYTFDKYKVDCPECIEKMGPLPPPLTDEERAQLHKEYQAWAEKIRTQRRLREGINGADTKP